jgi:hypothetical protein
MEGVSPTHIHAAGDAPDAQNLILLFQQDYFCTRFAGARRRGDTRNPGSNYHNLRHSICLLDKLSNP